MIRLDKITGGIVCIVFSVIWSLHWGKIVAVLVVTGMFSCANNADEPIEPPIPPVTIATKVGVAPYAIQHPAFKCQEFYNSLTSLKAYHLSWLWGTFGGNTECLQKFWADPRMQSIQVHLMNEVCVRNKNCGSYEVLAGLSVSDVTGLAEREEGWFKARVMDSGSALAAYINEQRMQRPDVACNISPGLETNTSAKGMANMIKWLRPLLPACTFTYGRAGSGLAGADFIENHNPYAPLPTPCIFNNDGVSITFPNYGSDYPRNFSSDKIPEIHHRFQNCEQIYFWHHSYNCINPRQFIDPRSRVCDEVALWGMLGHELGKLQGAP